MKNSKERDRMSSGGTYRATGFLTQARRYANDRGNSSSHPVLAVPLTGDKIVKDGEPRAGGEFEQIVKAGNRFSPPLVVYTPDVHDLFHLKTSLSIGDGFRRPLGGHDFYWFGVVRGRHGSNIECLF
jgi:hypothetical protein